MVTITGTKSYVDIISDNRQGRFGGELGSKAFYADIDDFSGSISKINLMILLRYVLFWMHLRQTMSMTSVSLFHSTKHLNLSA